MIKTEKFYPPPAFPPKDLSATEREMYSLGMKLTCAFELLATSSSSWSQRVICLWNEEKGLTASDAEVKRWEENCEEPDSEEWMTLSIEEVNRMLEEDMGEEEQVKKIIAEMSKIMEGESGFEGIDDGYFLSFV